MPARLETDAFIQFIQFNRITPSPKTSKSADKAAGEFALCR